MTSNQEQVLKKLNDYAEHYGLNIDPKRWIRLPQFGWMNPRVLALAMVLRNDYDIDTLEKLKTVKLKFKLKNKKYERIRNSALRELSGGGPESYLDLVIIKYLVAMINSR